jgi:hypothetical protein
VYEGGELGRLPAKQVVKRHRHVAELQAQKKKCLFAQQLLATTAIFFLAGLEEPVLGGGDKPLPAKKDLATRRMKAFLSLFAIPPKVPSHVPISACYLSCVIFMLKPCDDDSKISFFQQILFNSI